MSPSCTKLRRLRHRADALEVGGRRANVDAGEHLALGVDRAVVERVRDEREPLGWVRGVAVQLLAGPPVEKAAEIRAHFTLTDHVRETRGLVGHLASTCRPPPCVHRHLASTTLASGLGGSSTLHTTSEGFSCAVCRVGMARNVTFPPR